MNRYDNAYFGTGYLTKRVLATSVLSILAMGLVFGSQTGCAPSDEPPTGDKLALNRGESARQASSVQPNNRQCELTDSNFKCTQSVQGIDCQGQHTTVEFREEGEGPNVLIACGVASARLANSQRAENCRFYDKTRQHIKETHRVMKGACKAYIKEGSFVTLHGGTVLVPSPNGWWLPGSVHVIPGAAGGATGVTLSL